MMKRTNFVTRPIAAAAAIALLGLTLGSAQAALVDFSEDFDSGSAPDFTFLSISGTDFSVGGGTLNASNAPAFGDAGAIVELTNADGKDILMSTTFSASAFSGNSDIGFVAFNSTLSPASTGYRVDFKPSGQMRILEGPGFADISDMGTFPFALNTTYTVTLRATPNVGQLDLTLSVFDAAGTTLLGSTSGTSTVVHTGDFFGYRVFGGATQATATFDDFSVVEVIPEPASLALMTLGLAGMVSLRKRNRC